MNIVENNVPNQKWPMGLTDGIVQVRFLTFGQKHARNWSLRLPKVGIESNTNNNRNQLLTWFSTSTLSFMWFGVVLGLNGEKYFFGSFFVILGVIDLWVQIFWPRYVRLSWKFARNPIFVWGIRKKWSRVDLLTPQIPIWVVFTDIDS